MNQNIRTIIFLAFAAVSVGLAAITGWATRPNETVGGHEIGTPFFPDFDDALAATALQVASFDEDAARIAVFKVEQNDGVWQIPSHHNYPADGEERLANTATSMLGVERGALVSTSPKDHKRYRVLDPLDESVSGTEGHGDRITLFENDAKLLDLIIGDSVEDQQGFYYVRRADENQIYRARLGDFDLSTNFADWIEQDLLDLSSGDLVEMVVDPYHIDEVRGLKVQDEPPILLERKPATSSWALAGIDETQEQEKSSVISAMSSALAGLKIVGVRRKPASLINLFSGEGEARLTRSEQMQMQASGFFVVPPGEFLANEGEVQAGTKDGVRYLLQFGEVFTGTEVEIEVGSDAGADETDPATDNSLAGEDGESTGDEPADELDDMQDADDSQQRSRFLFVSVVFDESLIGDRPEPPIPPTAPSDEPASESDSESDSETDAGPGDSDAPADEASDEAPAASESETSNEAAEGNADEAPSDGGDQAADTEAETDEGEPAESDAAGDDASDPPADADNPVADDTPDASESESDDPPADSDDAPAPETPTPREIYEQELAAYETAQADYELELADFEEKIEAGNKRVQELNRRFAEWYYVISADLYEDLKVSRADLVEPTDPAEPEGASDLESLLQGLPPGDSPADPPEATDSTPDNAAPESSDDTTPPESDSPESAPSDSDSPAETPEAADSTDPPPAETPDPPGEPDEDESP